MGCTGRHEHLDREKRSPRIRRVPLEALENVWNLRLSEKYAYEVLALALQLLGVPHLLRIRLLV